MDDIVKQAMAKWPNVPHCYGWLGLDARGHWRMRDERAQQQGLAGDKIVHTALLAFITRNYTHDERGCWYFQNGPQRVYVNLEATPYIARTDAAGAGAAAEYVLHTGAPLEQIDAAFLTEHGELILQGGDIVAQLDDRDGALLLAALEIDGSAAGDEALLAWLEGENSQLSLRHRGQAIAVQRLARAEIAAHFGYVATPVAPT